MLHLPVGLSVPLTHGDVDLLLQASPVRGGCLSILEADVHCLIESVYLELVDLLLQEVVQGEWVLFS